MESSECEAEITANYLREVWIIENVKINCQFKWLSQVQRTRKKNEIKRLLM